MNLSDLFAFLNRIEARPKKGLSQNFLIDSNIVKKIVQTAGIEPGDSVIEVGPGPGALTFALLEAGANVFAIEKDTLFAKELSRFQTADGRLTVFEADFLEFDLKERKFPSPLKVVANLPYNITAPILEKFFDHSHLFSSLTIMVQKEVADRMGASAGTKDFGSLSVFTQFYTRPVSSFKVPPSCFYPQPKVDSTVVRLDFRPSPPIPPSPFFSLVRKAFQQRRKMISTSLRVLFSTDRIKKTLIAIGSRPDARPENLSLPQWVDFYSYLKQEI